MCDTGCASLAAPVWSGKSSHDVNIAARNIDRLFAQAVQCHQAGQLRDAEGLYRHVLRVDPGHTNSLYNAGLIGVQAGRPDIAVDLIGQAIARNDRIPEWHYNIAFAFCALGRMSDAIAHYKKAIALKPDYAEAHMNLGNVLKGQKRLDDAVACYQRVITLNPRAIEAHYNVANVLAEQEKWSDAALAYQLALSLKPGFAHASNNLGIVLAAQGQNDAAASRYRRAIALDPALVEAYVNLGKVLAEQGRLDDAVEYYRQAIGLKPDHAAAHNNLGVALMGQGRIDDAIAAFQDALARVPNSAEVHNNLGIAWCAIGKVDKALASYRRAITAKPEYIEAHDNLARALMAERATAEALQVLERALDIGETTETRALFVECLKDAAGTSNASRYRDLVLRAVVEPWARPGDLAPVAADLVLANSEIGAAVARASQAWPNRQGLTELTSPSELAALSHEQLLRALLESGCVPDKKLERFLTLLRFAVLAHASVTMGEDSASSDELELYSALARLCFISYYVFDCAAGEIELASALRERLEAALRSGANIPAVWPIAVAAYFPLHTLPALAASLSRPWPDAVRSLLAQQILEPEQEQACRASIPQLTTIENDVSRLVSQQYVENPYPRWIKPTPAPRPVSIDEHLRRLFPLGSFRALGKPTGIDVLIAGCGTGRHSTEVARRLTGARILAVDLSLTSLGYAKRQTLALGLDNIEYAQADILQLASLGRSFDVIEAAGSLQTLADPSAGWHVLSSLLRPGGFIFFGLYSEIARRDIVAARDFIAQRGYAANADGIRGCRQELLDFPDGTPLRNVTHTTEFYNSSECRDLLFHVQEHRTTLPEIKADLARHGLTFVGFEIDSWVRRRYQQRFPADKAMTDLDRWHELETDNPLMFVGMYQFWAQKD
jgi:tetratricopeptide (TPR) repeat protein/2-polyprenyl-3-methyl-5-hydroxy-6-metoxy-1,4-benzoquinol methylase